MAIDTISVKIQAIVNDEVLETIKKLNQEREEERKKQKEKWRKNIENLEQALLVCNKENCPGIKKLKEIKEEEGDFQCFQA